MSFPNIKITTQGKQLLTRALTGEAMEFTHFSIGSGTCGNSEDWVNLTGLLAPQFDVPFAEYEREGELVSFAGRFDTSTVQTAFWWRELAIFGTLTNDDTVGDVMVFYGNAGDLAEFVHAAGSEVAVTHSWTTKLALSSDADVSAVVNSTTYATTQQLLEHTNNTSNPHKVTKEQLGLGNVKNLAIEDETPVYDEAATLLTLRRGEKIKIAFGKIQKAITALISHLADYSNPHKLTNETLGSAPKNHRAEGSDYGMGTGTYFGHVKLTDDPTSTATANDGTAITPAGLAKALEDYTPSGGTEMDEDAIALAVEQALANAKESGEFDGATGEKGEDGVSPTASVEQSDEGAILTVTDANGTTTATLKHGEKGEKGDTGEQGEQGVQGEAGYTPQKYVDYMTSNDKEEVKTSVMEDLPVVMAEDGYADFYDLRQVTDMAITKAGYNITVVMTLQGDKTVSSSITLDDNGYPTIITTDGVEMAVSWEGFDA